MELLTTLHGRATDPGHRAALAFKLVSALMIQGDMARSLAVTEDALAEQVPSSTLRLRLEACRVLALADLHCPAKAHTLAAAVVAEAARLGDPLCGAEAHHAMAFALFHLGRGRESLRHVAEGIACARRSPEANDMRLLLLANQAEAHLRFDESETVAAALQEARELALSTRSTGRLVVTEARLAEFHYRLGDWDTALAGVARADGLPVSDGWLPVVVHGLRALVLGHRDEREAAQAELALLPPDAFAVPAARRYSGHVLLARALLAERAGRPADAVRELRRRWRTARTRRGRTSAPGCCRRSSAWPWTAGTRPRPGRRWRPAGGRRRPCPSIPARRWRCCAAEGCSRRTRSCWRRRLSGRSAAAGRWCWAMRGRTSRWPGPGTATWRRRGRR